MHLEVPSVVLSQASGLMMKCVNGKVTVSQPHDAASTDKWTRHTCEVHMLVVQPIYIYVYVYLSPADFAPGVSLSLEPGQQVL
jgi:hypothetical protein